MRLYAVLFKCHKSSSYFKNFEKFYRKNICLTLLNLGFYELKTYWYQGTSHSVECILWNDWYLQWFWGWGQEAGVSALFLGRKEGAAKVLTFGNSVKWPSIIRWGRVCGLSNTYYGNCPILQLGKGKFHLVGVSCVPGTRLDSFYAQWMYSSWHLLSIWNLFFTGEKTDGQGGRVTCLSLHVSKWQSQDWNQLASSALTLCFIF